MASRSCNGCTLCCTAIRVDSMAKPEWTHCRHIEPGVGCRIYTTRPDDCRNWNCGYLQDEQIAEHWYPRQCGMVLYLDERVPALEVRVDPANPAAWQAEPFYSDIKDWSARTLRNGGRVYVRVQGRIVVILPDRDIDLGVVSDDEDIVYIGPPANEPTSLRRHVYTKRHGGPDKGPADWR